MPAICTICSHEDVRKINSLLMQTDSNRRIAAQYSLAEASIRRHKKNHLSKQIARAEKKAEQKTVLTAQQILQEAQGLFNDMRGLLDDLKTKGTDSELTMKAHRECNRSLELLARLLGQLETVQTINVFLNPIFLQVRTKIVKALAPFPEARGAVVDALTDPDGDDFIEDIETVEVAPTPEADVNK